MLTQSRSPVLRSVCCGGHRCGWPAASLHPAHEFREGLGSRLPPPEHQRDTVLDWDSSASSSSAPGRGSAHHAYSWPTTPGLMLLTSYDLWPFPWQICHSSWYLSCCWKPAILQNQTGLFLRPLRNDTFTTLLKDFCVWCSNNLWRLNRTFKDVYCSGHVHIVIVMSLLLSLSINHVCDRLWKQNEGLFMAGLTIVLHTISPRRVFTLLVCFVKRMFTRLYWKMFCILVQMDRIRASSQYYESVLCLLCWFS